MSVLFSDTSRCGSGRLQLASELFWGIGFDSRPIRPRQVCRQDDCGDATPVVQTGINAAT